MRPSLKKDTPSELVEAIQRIEERADQCFGVLRFLTAPSNVAVWGLLVGGIRMVEREIHRGGDNAPALSATLGVVGRVAPIAIKWAIEHGNPPSKLATTRWSESLATKVHEALRVGYQYSGFQSCFPMWHRDRYYAELVSPELVRFTAPGTGRNRQVSAYQKAFRPKKGRFKVERAQKVEQTPTVRALFASVLQAARKKGMMRFEYGEPWRLWVELLPEYQARVNASARRSGDLALGDYTLEDFNRFYAGFLALCAAHDFLCFEWGRHTGTYPCDSAVMLRPASSWASVLAELTDISLGKCENIVSDLTFDFARSLDLHVHPLVPLDSTRRILAVAPQFPLHSRSDENILRVCSILRPDVFDATSLEKEPEMLDDLKRICPYSLQESLTMPKPHPDIDLLLNDEKSSTVVIAELKWVRKTLRPFELFDRDAEVLKGFKQLGLLRGFLTDNPDHLRLQTKLPRRLDDYEHVHYLLVARDHWLWVEPVDGVAIVEFEAFSRVLGRSEDLHAVVTDLLTYEWLPVEGTDFTVRYDRATVNGVSIESEVFYPA